MDRAYARCFWFLECYPSAMLLEVGKAVEGYLRFCNGVSGATVPSRDYLSFTW